MPAESPCAAAWWVSAQGRRVLAQLLGCRPALQHVSLGRPVPAPAATPPALTAAAARRRAIDEQLAQALPKATV